MKSKLARLSSRRIKIKRLEVKIWHLVLVLVACSLVSFQILFRLHPDMFNEKLQKQKAFLHMRTDLRNKISDAVNKNQFVPDVELEDHGELKKLKIHYTIDSAIQMQSEKLLKMYKPDYAAIVVMDANNGKILAMTSYLRNNDQQINLANKATYPAASVFKIVPASVALDKYNMDPETIMHFNGGNHTLYKRNVMNNDVNRWTRFLTLKEAFARSINTVFARLTFDKLNAADLKDYAKRYQFNQTIDTDFPIEISTAFIPEDKSFELAEAASGYNRINKLSPIQGAMMAGAIADDGQMHLPYIVDSMTDENGKIVYQTESKDLSKPLTIAGADKLRQLMDATVKQGTGRKSFRGLVKKSKFADLELGGKTGSLMGDEPKGKVDWFVGYGIRGDEKIAVAALTVNKEFWTVKAAYLAQTLFKEHFKENFASVAEKHRKHRHTALR